jgi:hypothetical protein
MPRRAESLHGCHEAETPAPAAMTCCCDSDAGAVPFTTSTLAAVAGAPLAIAVSPVNPVMPGGAAGAGKPNTTLLTRHLPLFTLFSAFLI